MADRFLYNLIVFVPLMVGMVYHFYPSAGEPFHDHCLCARRGNAAPPAKVMGSA